MDIREYLIKRGKTFINLEELEDLKNIELENEKIGQNSDYSEFVKSITKMIDEGIIRPIKNKNKTNGKVPSLFLKYRVLFENFANEVENNNNNRDIEFEIKHLSPDLEISKYLKNIDLYKKHREAIIVLDNFFKNDAKKLNVKISKNERAYQIWGYEKMLDSSIGKSILRFNNLEKKLNYYLTPEPFFDYIPKTKNNMTVLIVENKDTWYTLRKIFTENNDMNILGTEIDGLLYGEGNKITKEQAIEEYESQMLNVKANFLYWGDIDFTGIDMFERVKEQNKKADIQLFVKIYEKMIDMSDLKNVGQIRKHQNKNINLRDFLENFSDDYSFKIKSILNENKYLPQEVINYEVLKRGCD